MCPVPRVSIRTESGSPAGCRRRPTGGLRLGAGLLALALLAVASPGRSQGQDPREEAAALARQTEMLEKRVALASGDEFYLLLDASASKLQLMLKGAVLRDYPILGLEVGVPRRVFRPRDLAEGWQGRIWSSGSLSPPREHERVEIEPPPADSTAAGADSAQTPYHLPPTPEEAYPVPSRYHIRYAGGLSVEVRPREADQSAGLWTRFTTALHVWWPDFREALRRKPKDLVRLRIVLRPEDAASLYRALPPDTRLLVLPRS